MNNYRFKDYNPNWLWNNDYAIEPEISRDFYEDNLDDYDMHEESDEIYELVNMHNVSRDWQQYVYNTVSEFYKDKMPVWENEEPSWWVHFHIFNWDYKNINVKQLKYKILNCPLHCKIENDTLYSRWLNHRCAFNCDSLTSNSKNYFVCRKDTYLSHNSEELDVDMNSIEFRCNNVFDKRIYAYYIAVMIASQDNIKLKKLSNDARYYAQKWDTSIYDWPEVDLSDMYWYHLTEQDHKIMNINIQILVDVLIKNNLCKASDALVGYANENWFNVKAECILKDCLTWEDIKRWFIAHDIVINNNEYDMVIFKTKTNYYKFIMNEIVKWIKESWIDEDMFIPNAIAIKKKYSKFIKQEAQVISKLIKTWE